MKKAITSLMLVCILFISSTISVKAFIVDGNLLPSFSIFEGTGTFHEDGVPYDFNAYAITDADNNITIDFIFIEDRPATQFVLCPGEFVHYYNSDGERVAAFYEKENEDGFYIFNVGMYRGTLTMTSTADFTGTKIISNTTMSSTGEYMVVIGGSISGTFEAGRHQVTNATSQPLSIFIVNQTNGATRLMAATTINSMYVTVSGGQITKIEINGRAQTSPGNFDTYSIVI